MRWTDDAVVLVQPADPAEAHRPTWEPPRLDRDVASALLAPAVARGVPVVPVAVVGGQDTALFLSRGDWLARALHLDQALHLDRLPTSLTVPWGLGLGAVLPNVPLPARVAVEVLAPLRWSTRLGADPDPMDVAALGYGGGGERGRRAARRAAAAAAAADRADPHRAGAAGRRVWQAPPARTPSPTRGRRSSETASASRPPTGSPPGASPTSPP